MTLERSTRLSEQLYARCDYVPRPCVTADQTISLCHLSAWMLSSLVAQAACGQRAQ